MKIKNLIVTALLTALALVTFIIEAAIPPLTPIYGIKLGLANIFTLFTLYALGPKEAAALLSIRILLGSILTGQLMSFIYSFSGGLVAFLLMLILKRFFTVKQVWVLSVICAVGHNIGQLTAAVLLTSTIQLLYYLPVLLASGIITGALTGVTAQLVLLRLKEKQKN